MNARLFCKTGALAGSEYRIDEEVTIGRQEQNDITLPPEVISGRHARIFFDDEADCYVLEDLDSSNGTKLDDAEVVDPVPLEGLHVITFAKNVDFIFQARAEEAPSSSAEEGAKTQFGMAPESPSDLAKEEESEGERTRYGDAPGALPDLPEEESSSEEEEGLSEGEERTRFGEAPPELPDLSEEDEQEGERTRYGEAPDALPDLSEEESSTEEEEGPSEGEERTRFGEAPPDLPDLSDGDEPEDERTRIGGIDEPPPDLPSEESSEHERDDEAKEHTRMEGDAPALPDLPEEEPSTEEEEDPPEEMPPPSEAPTRAAPSQRPQPAESSPQYALQVILESGPQDTHPLPEGEVTIGRSSDCDIQIKDPGVSREHARLIVESNEVVVEDMGSKNFTFIDGSRLSGPTTLSPGSEIQFGLQVKAVLQRSSS